MTSRCGVLVHIEGTNQRYRSAGTLIIHIHVGIAIILLGKKRRYKYFGTPERRNKYKKAPQNYKSQPNPGVTSPSQVVMWSSVKKYQQR